MNINFIPFKKYIDQNATPSTLDKYLDSTIVELKITEDRIDAIVWGSGIYQVFIDFDSHKVHHSYCSCPYNHSGICKHIVHTLAEADQILKNQNKIPTKSQPQKGTETSLPLKWSYDTKNQCFLFENQKVYQLDPLSIETSCQSPLGDYDVKWNDLAINSIKISVVNYREYSDNIVELTQKDNNFQVSCTCHSNKDNLCSHIGAALLEVQTNSDFKIPFDRERILEYFRQYAAEMGIYNLSDDKLENLFKFTIEWNRVYIRPVFNILDFSREKKELFKKELLPSFSLSHEKIVEKEKFVVIETNEYQDSSVTLLLCEAPLAKSGKIKSPITRVEIGKELSRLDKKEEILFFSSFLEQNEYYEPEYSFENAQKTIKNPLNLKFYAFEGGYGSGKITPKQLIPIQVEAIHPKVKIEVKKEQDFYKFKCCVYLQGKKIYTNKLIREEDFLIYNENYYFLAQKRLKNLLQFFEDSDHEFYLIGSQFDSLKQEILDPLEDIVEVKYSFIKKASPKLIKKKNLETLSSRMIYLSDDGDWVLITPVVRYGETEVPLLSKRALYISDDKGQVHLVERNETLENRFLRLLQSQHPTFEDYPEMDFFYLHKKEFLEEGWFLDAFELWRKENIEILGFKQLKNNTLNPNKPTINLSVNSGIDWFDVHAEISFGTEEVDLKSLQKSIINKKRYVKLGDGTEGLLPEEWIQKFERFFRNGQVKGDKIQTHKSNFQLIDELFERKYLDKEIRLEIDKIRDKLVSFKKIEAVRVPKTLQANLRDYQKEGLNWLNFLDEFGFGGILADDMGLGKTIQIIAYFLSQIEKGNTQPNLVVVPTSLLFNWQRELDKFAPSLDYHLLYGSNRNTENIDFNKHEVILTSYGTLLSDIEVLRKTTFNCIVLDESQAIKNPSSKRYKAVCLLKARQRIAATGTPVENNTFDLYAQLSFVMPGLLGSQKKFKDDYSTPIDKYQDDQRAAELQQKVHPFILRRTKKQVAKELPEKTEMILTCEMKSHQRKIYDTYKNEFRKYLQGADESELQKSSLHILQGLTKLRQLCNSPALLSDQEYYGEESSKIQEIMYQVSKLKGDHKILIFSQFVGMLDLIKAELEKENIQYAYLTGKTNSKNREKEVEKFQLEEDVRVFLISLKAGGTGLNLTEAEYVFIVDPWWNPAVENQAIDRAYRIGQENNVIAVRFIVPDTIEEKILELQERKLKLVEDLIHTDSNTFKNLKKDDLLKLV